MPKLPIRAVFTVALCSAAGLVSGCANAPGPLRGFGGVEGLAQGFGLQIIGEAILAGLLILFNSI